MPLHNLQVSGSYYYPVMQKPNSSYPTVDFRELPNAPVSGSNIIRLFASGSEGQNTLYFVKENGAIVQLTGSIV